MEQYYKRVSKKEQEKKAQFSLILSPFINLIRDWLPFSIAEAGNCAYYTSKVSFSFRTLCSWVYFRLQGLVEAELLRFPLFWPKAIWIKLFENQGKKNKNNVNVVWYKRVPHAHRKVDFYLYFFFFNLEISIYISKNK